MIVKEQFLEQTEVTSIQEVTSIPRKRRSTYQLDRVRTMVEFLPDTDCVTQYLGKLLKAGREKIKKVVASCVNERGREQVAQETQSECNGKRRPPVGGDKQLIARAI